MSEDKIHPKNLLNDLTATEWTRFRKSWFVQDGIEEEWKTKKKHPATYPKDVAARFIEFFTRKNQTVLDPFMGSGSSLIAAWQLSRKAVGMDIYEHNVQLATSIMSYYYPGCGGHIIHGDCVGAMKNMSNSKKQVDYIIFSPPYADTLHKSSGGADTRHKSRKEDGLDTKYGDNPKDLGNMTVEDWLDAMVEVAMAAYEISKPGRYMTIIVQNEVRLPFVPIAWWLAIKINEDTRWELKPPHIWCQDNKPLGMTGHPKTFLTANHHHYCLHFKKPGELTGERPPDAVVKTVTNAMDFF